MDNQDSEKLKNENWPIGPATDDFRNLKKEETENANEDSGSADNQEPLIEENETETENPSLSIDEDLQNEESEPEGLTEDNVEMVENNSNEILPGNSNVDNIPEPTVVKKPFRKTLAGRLLFDILFAGFVFLSIFVFPSGLQKIAVSLSLMNTSKLTTSDSEMAESKSKLESRISELNKQLSSYVPDNGYIIINSIDNEFTLMKGNNVVRKGKCSTGSMTQLEDDKRGKKFIFQTPKGLRKVLRKKKDPVWTKPDWAYIDDGLPIPSPSDPSRIEEGVLGDYALELGNGYMIHGTIWQRYLGLPVTHGCVRLNDDDLQVVFNTLEKGSNVYIY